MVVEGLQSDLLPSTQAMIVFITPKVNRSITCLVYLRTLGLLKRKDLSMISWLLP